MKRSLFAELRRRNVIRAAVLYIGAVWALTQGIAQLTPVVNAPEWAARWFLVAACIGFPFWVGFAWYYEFTPEGLKRESEIDPADSITAHTGKKLDRWIFAIMGVAIVLLLTDRFVLRHGVNQPAAAVPEHSIAVLPFENRSEDKGQGYFADGIAEDMLNLLAKVPALKVISRSSSFSFKGKGVPLREIAQTLGVAYVLEGSVQRAGKTLRISAQLIDARSDQSVWSEAYDRALDDVFAIQDEIAGAVVGQLKLKLLGKAREIDPEAYAMFLQARQLQRSGTRDGYEQAIPMLQEVLAKVPGYAPAWQQLGAIYSNQTANGLRPASEGTRLARETLQKAITADPDLAPAYANLGWLEVALVSDLAAAAGHFERALALDPADATILGNSASLEMTLGKPDLAVALQKASLAHDPLAAINYAVLGGFYYNVHRPDEAIASFRTALRLAPGRIAVRSIIGLALLQKGANEEALVEVRQEPEEIYRLIALPTVFHALGRHVESDAALAELISKFEKEAPYNIAAILAARGEPDRAFEWLDRAQTYEDTGLNALHYDPLFDKLHQDPRWLPLLRKLGKAPEQLEQIKFDIPQSLLQPPAGESTAAR